MKKLLSLLVLIAIAPFVLNADINETMDLQTQRALNFNGTGQEFDNPVVDNNTYEVEKNYFNRTPGAKDTLLFPSAFPSLDYSSGATSMTYEPISQTVNILNAYHVVYTNSPSEGYIDVWNTQDMGASFIKRRVMEMNDQTLPLWGSITTFNTTKSNDPNELEYILTYRVREYNASSQDYPLSQGMHVRIVPPSSEGEPSSFPNTEPYENNDEGGYQYSYGRMASFQNDEEAYAYLVGTADAVNYVDFQAGKPFFASFSLEDEDIDADMMLPKFDEEHITFPGAKNEPYSSGNFVDTDRDGNVYVAHLNFIAPNNPFTGTKPEDKMRTVSFMKSTDHGNTWGDLISFPTKRLIDYLHSQGQSTSETYMPLGGDGPYLELGFAVTDNDKLSMVIGLNVNVSEDESKIVLTEFSYDNGTWNDPTPIHELPISSFSFWTFARSQTEIPIDSLRFRAGEGLEIELAKVYGTDDLVLKFAQYTDDKTSLDSTFNIKVFDGTTGVVDQIDSVQNVGIYGTSKIAGKWLPEVLPIVDRKDRNESSAQIPKIVPSAEEVPMMWSVGYRTSDSTSYRYNYPMVMFDMISSWWHAYFFGTYDFTKLTSVEENTPIVSEVNMNVYPNPASANAYVEYTSANENVRMEIFDAMGNRVMSVINDDIQSAGTKTTPIDVTKLANGTYYVYLTVGNETFTKTLNVVR